MDTAMVSGVDMAEYSLLTDRQLKLLFARKDARMLQDET